MNPSNVTKNNPIRLYVVISDRCNLSCKHCLVPGGPQAKRWMLSKEDVELLCQTVNQNECVTTIHFTGGEPTLFVREMTDLQRQILRPIKYTMSTNGALGGAVKDFLKKVRIDEINLSYDRYHEENVANKTLSDFVKAASERRVPVTVNCVFDEVVDLEGPQFLVQAGARLATNRLIRSGRAGDIPLGGETLKNKNCGRCPSLEVLQSDGDPYEKIIYFPGEGFTNCCGPLVFGQSIERRVLFAETLAGVSDTSLRHILDRVDYLSVLEHFGIKKRFNTPCEACAFVLNPVDNKTGPSLFDIFENKDEIGYWPITGQVSAEMNCLLSEKHIVSTFLTLDPPFEGVTVSFQGNTPDGIKVEDITRDKLQEVEQFLRHNYYESYSKHYSTEEIESRPKITYRYFEVTNAMGKFYRRDGQLVALILMNDYLPHPGLGVPTRHIGYGGYEKGQVTREEARWIKRHWFSVLTDNGTLKTPVDCSVETFNDIPLKFAKQRGFKVKMLRLDRRSS